ncbi:MAG: 50S ribosomal protein L18 [Planctomycetes bacterium]|nr:50S ribosomal protein L18 [Planctomycetota bacterium]
MNHERAVGKQRKRRRNHVRRIVRGTAERPRLSVHRSHCHIYAQVIDDLSGKTLASASSRDKQLRGEVSYGGNKDAAASIGKAVALRALAAGVKQVAFDRGSYQYHGRIAALADAAREAGLSF